MKAIFKLRMKTLFQYRAAAFAGILTQLFWGLIFVMIFRTFYGEQSVVEPITLSQTITFIWVGQALLHLLPLSIDKELEGQIRSGNVAYELVRPIHLYGLWFARSFALRLIPTVMRCIPVFIVGGLWLGLSAPVSGSAAAFLSCR